MKVIAGTEEVIKMLEGLGMMEGFKESLNGAILATLGSENINKLVEPRVAQSVKQAIEYHLHGNGWAKHYDGPVGKEIQTWLTEQIKYELDVRAAINEALNAAFDSRLRKIIGEEIEKCLQENFRILISERLAKADIDQIIREQAKTMIAAALAKLG